MCQGLMSFENVSGGQTPQEFKKIKGLTKVKADVQTQYFSLDKTSGATVQDSVVKQSGFTLKDIERTQSKNCSKLNALSGG